MILKQCDDVEFSLVLIVIFSHCRLALELENAKFGKNRKNVIFTINRKNGEFEKKSLKREIRQNPQNPKNSQNPKNRKNAKFGKTEKTQNLVKPQKAKFGKILLKTRKSSNTEFELLT